MRRAAALMVLLAAACSTGGVTTTSVAPGTSTTTTPATTVPASTTTASSTTTTPATTTTTTGDDPPVVDMVPAGFDIEGFIPLVEGYFAVRNWALEHPDLATEEILATVIEPGSVEMRDTLDEIGALVEQGARYEGLTETFELREARLLAEHTDVGEGVAEVSTSRRYGNTARVTSGGSSEEDSLRALAWTLEFVAQPDGTWLVASSLRNEPIYPGGGG